MDFKDVPRVYVSYVACGFYIQLSFCSIFKTKFNNNNTSVFLFSFI